jgi:hypothetical protein
MVAIARVVFTSREHIIALEARGKGLMGVTLRYPYEVRKEADFVAPRRKPAGRVHGTRRRANDQRGGSKATSFSSPFQGSGRHSRLRPLDDRLGLLAAVCRKRAASSNQRDRSDVLPGGSVA